MAGATTAAGHDAGRITASQTLKLSAERQLPLLSLPRTVEQRGRIHVANDARPCPRSSKRTCSRFLPQSKPMQSHASSVPSSSERFVTTQPIAPTLRLPSPVDKLRVIHAPMDDLIAHAHRIDVIFFFRRPRGP